MVAASVSLLVALLGVAFSEGVCDAGLLGMAFGDGVGVYALSAEASRAR